MEFEIAQGRKGDGGPPQSNHRLAKRQRLHRYASARRESVGTM